ncbi:TrmH family RNA methyltransferase [Pseudoflavonifractor sp.]|jgi:TrmH family RNA methyltransferase|uniref:TrmH family RNA methyltransferase n=1 Tax=Pseudoflavonifractor sp. TaxID=1980281 RepID=UPI003D8E3ED3
MEHITSRQNPLMVRIKKLGQSRALRREEGVFVCEGPKLIEEALKWGASVETVLTAEGRTWPEELSREARQVEVPDSLLRAVSSVETPQGLLAVCRTPALTPPDKLSGGRYLVLDGVQDPGNLGTIWRTADAFGADGLLLVNGCADPWSPKTIRATMGACFRLPAWETDLETIRILLDGADIPLYATALREDTVDVRDVDLKRAAVVIGSEGRGISEEALALCRRTIKIPMRTRCESLNAAMAAGVVLWEMCR